MPLDLRISIQDGAGYAFNSIDSALYSPEGLWETRRWTYFPGLQIQVVRFPVTVTMKEIWDCAYLTRLPKGAHAVGILCWGVNDSLGAQILF